MILHYKIFLVSQEFEVENICFSSLLYFVENNMFNNAFTYAFDKIVPISNFPMLRKKNLVP